MADTDSGGPAPEAPAQPAKTGRAGRDLPAAIGVSLLLGGTIIAILLFAPHLWVALVAVGVPVARECSMVYLVVRAAVAR